MSVSMPEPGAVLSGKYRLVRELGAGGMGRVYEADHLRLRQPFAVKVLQAELSVESEFIARFEREARAAAALRSPHVVRVFDVDTTPEGLVFIVMELLEGEDLAACAINQQIPVADLVDWVVQTCSALQEAHDAGIIHRDLKPANIFLARMENGERIAKILDFGISKFDAASTSALTGRVGAMLGTPTFMAPEQIRNRRVDGRTDLWAMGVLLYRLLGSRWPFNGDGDQSYLASVIADPPLPFELVRPDLPFELSSAIMKALEKDPADRFSSAMEMAAALARFGSGKAPLTSMSSLRPPSPAAVVVPVSPQSRADRAGNLATVLDTPRAAGADTSVDHGALSPPATSFAPPSTTASRRSRAWPLPIAAAAAAVIGFCAYLVATSSTFARPHAAQPTEDASLAPAAPSAVVETASLSPQVSEEIAGQEAQPAPTGVPQASTTASAIVKPRRVRPRASSERVPSSSAAPPPDAIPAHL